MIGIVLALVAAFDLAAAIAPMPAPPRSQTIYLPGGGMIRDERSYSSTAVATIRVKNWAQVCLNPVGWAAVFKGYGPDTLYQLQRQESWKTALNFGQWLTLLALVVLSLVFWSKSAGREEELR